jgi:hypothetical protein
MANSKAVTIDEVNCATHPAGRRKRPAGVQEEKTGPFALVRWAVGITRYMVQACNCPSVQ